jgi:hypothetical protein
VYAGVGTGTIYVVGILSGTTVKGTITAFVCGIVTITEECTHSGTSV